MNENAKALRAPLDEGTVRSLHAGDRVLLSGTIYTARDAAHRRMDEAIRTGGALPFPPEGAVIFYAGPAPARPGSVIGPIGPTTSGGGTIYLDNFEYANHLFVIKKRYNCKEVGVSIS